MDAYKLWSTHPYFDEATRRELLALDGDEREDRFYRELAFGTGGLRGVIGAGTNRINRYTVRKATWGLATYVTSVGRAVGSPAPARGVVIAHDSRRFSPEFALETALTLAAAGVKAYVFRAVTPTPLLSYAVRELGAMAGVVITASHNPPTYNGYKVYWEDGGQVPPERAAAILAQIDAVADITTVVPMAQAAAEAAGLLVWLDERLENQYVQRVAGLSLRPDRVAAMADACRILYTPLHGAGNRPVRKVLAAMGFRSVSVVPAQELPDGDFPTVASPNPEEPAAFALALELAADLRPDLILATDPDADRLGVAVPDGQGSYRLLTGNQIGALLTAYILEQRRETGTLPADGVVVKTIATSNLAAALTREYGVRLENTLTGFKFIGEKIAEYEATGSGTFLFGYEESYGYLAATFVRDKDAVMAAALVAELAADCRARGVTLLEQLEALWQRYGYFREALYSLTLAGKAGLAQIGQVMAALRAESDPSWLELPVQRVDDYLTATSRDLATGRVEVLTLPTSDVLHYHFPGGGYLLVRPSGTEPKIKLYLSVTARDGATADKNLSALQERIKARVAAILA